VPEPTRVLIVEDHPIVADGLQLALSRNEDLRVVGTASTLADAQRLAARVLPSVVVLDYHLPDGTGAEAAGAIRQAAPDAAFIILTADTSDETMLSSIEAGVSGYVVKSEAAADIVDAVRRVAAGEMLIPPTILAGLLARQRQRAERAVRRHELRERLTPRETEILQLVARGVDNRAIADRLGISIATVRVHVQKVIEKLGAHSRLEAVVRANDHGLIEG
jgi:DNA-binding NarL/FixJ family response regulator